MTDIKTPEDRSRNMAAIKRADTKPELYIRKMLFAKGYRFRLQNNALPGHPDLWMKKYNVAIFINGCFWHRHDGCKYAYIPKSRVEFWNEKFRRNKERDQIVKQQLAERGIRCLVIWECTIKEVLRKTGNPEQLFKDIMLFLDSEINYKEL